MSKFSEYIGSQLGNPRGVVGKCCCVIMNVINNVMYRNVVRNINADEHSSLLDVGYGNGYLISKMYKKFSSDIYGIDISEDMKNQAIGRNQKAVDIGKVQLSVGDCCDLKFDDGFFDAVTTVNTIYFWNDTEKGMSEIYRVLKNGGVFCNAVYSETWLKKWPYTKTGFKFFGKEELEAIGEKVGFSEVEIYDVIKGKSYIVVYRKQG